MKVKPVCAAEEIEVITGLVENGFGIAVLPYMDIVRLHKCGDDSGEDFRVEFQILHCEKKVWNPLRAGGGIFSVLEKRTSLKFIKNPCIYREKKSIICFMKYRCENQMGGYTG